MLAAGAPAVEQPVPESVRTLPESVRVRWFGAGSPAPVDYARRQLQAMRTGEPAHVGYVERPALLAALAAAVRDHRPDVVHAFGWGTAGLWRHTDGVPVVHMAVDAWHRNAGNRRLPVWRRPLAAAELGRIRGHERRHYPHDAAVVVVAPDDAAELRRLAPDARIEVVANGVDAGDEPAALPAAPVLGFHGSFEAQHNVDAARVLVRDVLPEVRRAVPDARVLLVGRSPGPAVRALAGPDVELRADVADARAELADVTVYVAPLVSGWGLKNKVLEAMAAGRPVVTTARGAAGIGAGPGVHESPDVAGLAPLVVALLHDRAGLAAQGEAGRRRVVTDFTWAGSAAAIEALWERAAAEGAPR